MKKLLIVLAFMLYAWPAEAQYVERANCATLVAPVTNATTCKQTTTVGGRDAGVLYNWNGSAWVAIVGGGGGGGGAGDFSELTGTASDAQIPHLNTLSTGLTAERCVRTAAGTGVFSVAAADCPVIGVDVQAFDADLSRLGGLTLSTTGQILYFDENAGGAGVPGFLASQTADCPTGPVTFNSTTRAWGCGTYPGGSISGTAGTLPVISGGGGLVDSLISQSGSTVTINGNLAVGTCPPCLTPNTGDLTVDRALYVPDADSTVVVPTTATAGQFVTHVDANGVQQKAVIPLINRTKLIHLIVGADSGATLADTDDQQSIFVNRYGQGVTITEIYCETDQGTATINLQRDDGSPANIATSNLACTPSGVSTTTFTGSEASIADTNKVDFIMVQATTSGTPKSVRVTVKATLD